MHEILSITPPLARALRTGSLQEFEHAAAAQLKGGTIADHVLKLVLQGKTTVAEAMKVVSAEEA